MMNERWEGAILLEKPMRFPVIHSLRVFKKWAPRKKHKSSSIFLPSHFSHINKLWFLAFESSSSAYRKACLYFFPLFSYIFFCSQSLPQNIIQKITKLWTDCLPGFHSQDEATKSVKNQSKWLPSVLEKFSFLLIDSISWYTDGWLFLFSFSWPIHPKIF